MRSERDSVGAGEPTQVRRASFDALVRDARRCVRCAPVLPLGPRPVFQLHAAARLLIAAQAPSRTVHETGVAFNDASGERLRAWLGLTRDVFYDARRVAILPMGLCFPGGGASGDLPPRPECAPVWRAPLLAHLRHVRLTLAIGRHAVRYHLPQARGALADTVRAWRAHADCMALPHPSPRNNGWLALNPWFERELLPLVRERVAQALDRP
ncbi:MAG: uracil-DNA glycosylase family protein [Burkholderiaceae bacterium]|nr:uracil-DNA glycosylase family protein [Burkholderiaceae bacterium]